MALNSLTKGESLLCSYKYINFTISSLYRSSIFSIALISSRDSC